MLLTIWPLITISKGTLCHVIWILVYNLANLAINCHFRHFCQICHFRQNRHFPKGPLMPSHLIFVYNLAISAFNRRFAIFQRAPLPSHLNFCLQFGDLAFNRRFRYFRQIRHFCQILYSLVILAINHYFCYFRQCEHFWTHLFRCTKNSVAWGRKWKWCSKQRSKVQRLKWLVDTCTWEN